MVCRRFLPDTHEGGFSGCRAASRHDAHVQQFLGLYCHRDLVDGGCAQVARVYSDQHAAAHKPPDDLSGGSSMPARGRAVQVCCSRYELLRKTASRAVDGEAHVAEKVDTLGPDSSSSGLHLKRDLHALVINSEWQLGTGKNRSEGQTFCRSGGKMCTSGICGPAQPLCGATQHDRRTEGEFSNLRNSVQLHSKLLTVAFARELKRRGVRAWTS